VSLGSIVGAEDFEQTMADCFGSLKNPKNFFPRPPNIPIFTSGNEFEDGAPIASPSLALTALQQQSALVVARQARYRVEACASSKPSLLN
jgi:hypothetical protein